MLLCLWQMKSSPHLFCPPAVEPRRSLTSGLSAKVLSGSFFPKYILPSSVLSVFFLRTEQLTGNSDSTVGSRPLFHVKQFSYKQENIVTQTISTSCLFHLFSVRVVFSALVWMPARHTEKRRRFLGSWLCGTVFGEALIWRKRPWLVSR